MRRERLPFSVSMSGGDGDHLGERQIGFGDDQRRHQLGQRGNRQHRLRVLAVQHFVGVGVKHEGDAGLEVERVGRVVQAVELAERRTRRLGDHHGRDSLGTGTGARRGAALGLHGRIGRRIVRGRLRAGRGLLLGCGRRIGRHGHGDDSHQRQQCICYQLLNQCHSRPFPRGAASVGERKKARKIKNLRALPQVSTWDWPGREESLTPGLRRARSCCATCSTRPDTPWPTPRRCPDPHRRH